MECRTMWEPSHNTIAVVYLLTYTVSLLIDIALTNTNFSKCQKSKRKVFRVNINHILTHEVSVVLNRIFHLNCAKKVINWPIHTPFIKTFHWWANIVSNINCRHSFQHMENISLTSFYSHTLFCCILQPFNRKELINCWVYRRYRWSNDDFTLVLITWVIFWSLNSSVFDWILRYSWIERFSLQILW